MYWFTALFVLLFGGCSASNLTEVERLYENLLKNYNKYVRPLDTSAAPVVINASFYLVGVKEFDEVNGMFSVTGFLRVTWKDSRLQWDPSSYGGLQYLELPEIMPWIPNISLLNPFVKVESIAKGVSPVRFSSTGVAVWLPGNVLSSRCEVDVTKYPFDTQTCRMLFGCWGYPSSSIVVQAPDPEVNLFYFIEHDTWEIVEQRAYTVSDLFLTYVSVDFTMKRHPGFAIINVIAPMILLLLLNMFVFILPIDSGERLSFAVTLLLAIAVFLTIVEDNLPPTSDPISLLSYFVLADLGISSFICFVVVVGLAIYSKDQSPVPNWLSQTAKAFCYRKRITKMISKNDLDEENEDGEDFLVTWKMVSSCIDTFMIIFCMLFVIFSNVLFFMLVTL